jgi:hypothetical protein
LRRVYVTVDCRQFKSGEIKPLRIHWHDGRVWEIKRLLHSAYPVDDEFKGVRYTVLIGDAEKYLYRYNDQWYVMADA